MERCAILELCPFTIGVAIHKPRVQERKGELCQRCKPEEHKRKKKSEGKREQAEARRLHDGMFEILLAAPLLQRPSGEGGVTQKTIRKVHRRCEE